MPARSRLATMVPHMADLTAVESHFEFGRNWRSFAASLSGPEIDDATDGLRKLLGIDSLADRSFLDIGCGSGIHALAALRLGARNVVALDIDPDSVDTTQQLLARHAPGHAVDVRLASVFDTQVVTHSSFDAVYSWGVLHHTGRMHEALRRAAALVRPGGMFAFALYRKTWCCALWKLEKRWYRDAGERSRRHARSTYLNVVKLGMLLTGRSYRDYLAQYPGKNRGMDFLHDVHDWLGGFPYESISPKEVDTVMHTLGFELIRRNVRTDMLSRSGILGSGCDEYVYRRVGPEPSGAT